MFRNFRTSLARNIYYYGGRNATIANILCYGTNIFYGNVPSWRMRDVNPAHREIVEALNR